MYMFFVIGLQMAFDYQKLQNGDLPPLGQILAKVIIIVAVIMPTMWHGITKTPVGIPGMLALWHQMNLELTT